jgi:hypothetical protein
MSSEATVAIAPMEPMEKESGGPAEPKKPINKITVYMGVQGVIEAFCVFLGIQGHSLLGYITQSGLFFMVGAIIALLVCVNVGGQLVCNVTGKCRRTGSSCHLIFLLIAIGLSCIPMYDFSNAQRACAVIEDWDLNEETEKLCGRLEDPMITMLIYIGIVACVMRLVTAGLMVNFCCCGRPAAQTVPV